MQQQIAHEWLGFQDENSFKDVVDACQILTWVPDNLSKSKGLQSKNNFKQDLDQENQVSLDSDVILMKTKKNKEQ